jgi:hypothetical protein
MSFYDGDFVFFFEGWANRAVQLLLRHGSNQGNTRAEPIRLRKSLISEDIGENWPPAGQP